MSDQYNIIMRNPIFSIVTVVTLFIISFAGCSDSKTENEIDLMVETFPVQDSLPGKRIDLPYGECLSNMVSYAGDYLIFRAIRAPYFLQIYDRRFNLVDTILHKGEGPEELPDMMWFGQWSGADNNPSLTIFSDPKKRVAKVNVHPFTGITTVCDIPVSEGLSPSSIYEMNDTAFVGISLDMETGSDLFCYNPETKKVRKAEKPFKFIEGPMSFYTSQQTMAYNPDSKDICCAYINFPTMVIYDYSFKIKRKINIGIKVDTSTYDYKEQYPNLVNVAYIGRFITVLRMEPKTAESDLLVFDDDGTPRACYSVGKAVGYTIDIKGKRLLTIKYDQDNDLMYIEEHSLPELLTEL